MSINIELIKGADAWIDHGIDLLQVGDNEFEWGFINSNFDHPLFNFTEDTKLGGGFFKSSKTARKRMLFELMNNNEIKKRANSLYWRMTNYQMSVRLNGS